MDFKRDEEGKLQKYFDRLIATNYPDLSILKFLYVWRLKHKFDEDQVVVAEVFKLSNRERDIFGYDVRLEVDKEQWLVSSKEERYKVAFHELAHVRLEYEDLEEEDDEDEDEDSEDNLEAADPVKTRIAMDKHNRIKFYLEPHDINLKRFKMELLEFGLDEQEEQIRVFLNKVKRKFKEA